MFIVSLTLVPALQAIFGRGSFNPFISRTPDMSAERARKRGKLRRISFSSFPESVLPMKVYTNRRTESRESGLDQRPAATQYDTEIEGEHDARLIIPVVIGLIAFLLLAYLRSRRGCCLSHCNDCSLLFLCARFGWIVIHYGLGQARA